jgi:hypothetical protein
MLSKDLKRKKQNSGEKGNPRARYMQKQERWRIP